MAEPDKTPVSELPYEKVVERLAATVERLEAGELTLDEQIAAFDEGMKLVRRGQGLLDEAERKVEQLMADGSVAPLEVEGGASETEDDLAF